MTDHDRTFYAGADGYFCISEAGSPILQGEINEHGTEIHIMGDKTITLDKMFGPLIFWPIRATADIESCEWVIERLHGEDNEWHEVARIPGQREEDFADAPE